MMINFVFKVRCVVLTTQLIPQRSEDNQFLLFSFKGLNIRLQGISLFQVLAETTGIKGGPLEAKGSLYARRGNSNQDAQRLIQNSVPEEYIMFVLEVVTLNIVHLGWTWEISPGVVKDVPEKHVSSMQFTMLVIMNWYVPKLW